MPIEASSSQADPQSLPMVLHPVGTISNSIKEPFLKAGDGGLKMQGKMDDVSRRVRETRQGLSEITINAELEGILDGIDEYSHIVVLYWGHKVPEQGRTLTKIHPMGREDQPLMGVFSTCSPARPNPILMTVVQLRQRKGNVLTVAGLDAIDGTPVLDIKPYVDALHPRHNVAVAGWMRALMEEMDQ